MLDRRSVIERARDEFIAARDVHRLQRGAQHPTPCHACEKWRDLAAELDALLGEGEPHPDTARLRFLAVDAPFDELYGADLHELASEEVLAGAAEDEAYLRAMRRVIYHGRLIADSPSPREDVPGCTCPEPFSLDSATDVAFCPRCADIYAYGYDRGRASREDVPEPYRAEPCPQCGAIRKVSGIPDAHFCAIKPEEPKR